MRKGAYDNVVCAGLDVHRHFSTVAMRDGSERLVRRERLDHRDRPALVEQIQRWPRGLPVVLEASFGWGWVTDLLVELGMRPMLSNCYKVEQMRKARGLVKTNDKDAELLSLLVSEKQPWWRVWLAPPAVRDRREWMRHRAALVGEATEAKNRIHALLARHGIDHGFSDLFGAAGRAFLVELCREGRAEWVQLEAGALTALRGQVRLLEHLRGQLAELAGALRGQLQRDPLIRRIDGIPGFGLILSHMVVAEVGQIERFRHDGALASYALLAPRCDDTGEADPSRPPQGRHLGQRGNKMLQWVFLEAARGAVRTGGRWRAMFDRYTQGGRVNRNRGYIKVARELVKVVYVVWKKDVPYRDTPPPRPGQRAPAEEFVQGSRSGTGQPFQPMTAVQ